MFQTKFSFNSTNSTQADRLSGKMAQLHNTARIFWSGMPLTQTSGVTQTLKPGLCSNTSAFISLYCEMVALSLDPFYKVQFINISGNILVWGQILTGN